MPAGLSAMPESKRIPFPSRSGKPGRRWQRSGVCYAPRRDGSTSSFTMPAIAMRVPFLRHGFRDWQHTIDVHLSAGFRLSQAVAQHMVKQEWGRIIFTSSILASIGREHVPAYSAAKAGMNALMRGMATELACHGITVNAIAPGYFATELTRPPSRESIVV